MKFVYLLSVFAFLVACSEEGGVFYVFDEKKREVMLTDLYGLKFSLLCRIDADSKKCGVVFDDFTYEKTEIHSSMMSSSWYYTLPGFKDASILSIQVKNENTGNAKPLISYFQDVNTYMAGDPYVPSATALYADQGKPRSEISLTGFYEGDKWVEQDTTILIGDTLFSNDEGLLDFAVIDRNGHKARLVVDLGKMLKKNDGSSVKSMNVAEEGSSETSVRYYWEADSGSVTFEPIDVNFQYPKSVWQNGYGSSYSVPQDVPFLRLSNFPKSDGLILNGGVNESSVDITVVNYAK